MKNVVNVPCRALGLPIPSKMANQAQEQEEIENLIIFAYIYIKHNFCTQTIYIMQECIHKDIKYFSMVTHGGIQDK